MRFLSCHKDYGSTIVYVNELDDTYRSCKWENQDWAKGWKRAKEDFANPLWGGFCAPVNPLVCALLGEEE